MERKTIPEELQVKIEGAFKSKNIKKICPICGKKLELADSYMVHPVYSRIDQPTSDNWTIPCVMLLCANCGYISQHALGALGLMQEAKDAEKNEK